MKNWLKFFMFFISGTVLCYTGVEARPNYKNLVEVELNKPDEKTVVKVKREKKSQIYIDSSIAEVALADWLAKDRNKKIDRAVKVYDKIAKKNNGKMSVSALFVVCMAAYDKKKSEMLDPQVQNAMWPVCIQEFIRPLVDLIKDTDVYDVVIQEVYDGTRFNESCTASVRVENVANIICASGNYSFDPAFEKAMITKFRLEGGCADVGDGNGITCFGVGEKYHPEANNCSFSRVDAEKIAYDQYYKNFNLDLLPDAIRGDIYMAIWGTGDAKRSIQWLQRILGVTADGLVGPVTVNAARNYKGNLRKQYLKRRYAHLKSLEGFPRYGNGWSKAVYTYLKNGCHSETNDNEQIKVIECPRNKRSDYDINGRKCVETR
jgi:lysozyme family protein